MLAGAIAIRSWTLVDPDRLPRTSRRLDRTIGVFFMIVAFFLTIGLHLPGLVDVWSGDLSSNEYLADPVVFWLVKLMDLGLVVPALLASGVCLLQRRPWARKLKHAMVGWTVLLGASVAGMAVMMQANADPGAGTGNVVVFIVFAAIALALAAVVYQPLVRRQEYTSLGRPVLSSTSRRRLGLWPRR